MEKIIPKTDRKTICGNLLRQLIKFKSQQKYLEATQKSLQPILNSVDESNELNDIERMKIDAESNWSAYKQKLLFNVGIVTDMIDDFKTNMMNELGPIKYTVKEYRERIEAIDRKLCEKQSLAIDELKRLHVEYCDINETITNLSISHSFPLNSSMSATQSANYTRNMTASRPINSSSNMRRTMSAPIERDEMNDIRQFDTFLREHKGHCGGWLDEEHRVYIKIKAKYKRNLDKVCSELKSCQIGNYH